MLIHKSYFLSTTSRSGSSLLCEGLASTGIAGKPREYFKPDSEKGWFENLGVTGDSDYLARILQAGATPNGVFGAKVMWHQLLQVTSKLRMIQGTHLRDLEVPRGAFPDLRYIFLRRRDKVAQAVSYFKAIKSGFWHAIEPLEGGERPRIDFAFDFEAIDREVIRFTRDEANWCQYFDGWGIEPFELVYEDFPHDYESTVLAILRFLEIPIRSGLRIKPPKLRKLRDGLSEEWAERYREIKKGKNRAIIRWAQPAYLLCASPRTGSNLLAEALESTGIAGRPKEYFDPEFERHWTEDPSIWKTPAYLEKIVEAGTSPNGVFAAKAHWHQLVHLQGRLRAIYGYGSTTDQLLQGTLPALRHVFLTRRDKVRQAISYYKAIKTGVWWSIRPDPTQPPLTPTPACVPPPFDFEQIDHWVNRLTYFDSRWRRYFEALGVEPFEVVYEDLVEAYESTVLAILRYLEIPFTEGMAVAPPRLKKQADEVSEEWVQRYHALTGPTKAMRKRSKLSYFIASTPRTGSTLLAEALESTQVAGKPKEYFDPNYEDQWFKALDISTDSDYLVNILAAGMTMNGVFGAKVHWHQFTHLTAKLQQIQGGGLSDREHLAATFPDLRFVLLVRRDKVRQAVSYYRAIQTGVWWSIRPETDEPRQTPAPEPQVAVPVFDFEQIDHWVRALAEFESNWRRYLQDLGVKPFEVVYEDFAENYDSTILAVLDYLGISMPAGQEVAPPRLRKMADELSEEWVRRYRELGRR
jgi:trehalose 2-sulfotransferase